MKVFIVTYYDYNEPESWKIEGVFDKLQAARNYVNQESKERQLGNELGIEEWDVQS